MQNREAKTEKIIALLRTHTQQFPLPLVDTIIQEYGGEPSQTALPFLILISCLLSLRAKDIVTVHVCRTLFEKAQTPQELLKIPRETLEAIVFRAGCYKKRARVLETVSRIIHEEYGDVVPNTREELLAIPGIGRKTANLVLGLAFDIPAICVDTHVHRISNRLGLVNTKTPDETEKALEQVIPREHWILWNKLLVMWGQNICLPRFPKCVSCAIKNHCSFPQQTLSKPL